MRKKVGIIKQVLFIGLAFLLSINSFAAIVSDNDGSAFITKAEFEALKSSFQKQIVEYNQSIDSKIDDAISAYLAGINISKIYNVSMPTSQRLFKTLDVANFPQTWDSVRLNVLYTFTTTGQYCNFASFPFTIKFHYDQNDMTNTGKNLIAECFNVPLASSYWIYKGWSEDYVDNIQLLIWKGGSNYVTSQTIFYKIWQNIEFFQGTDSGRNYTIDATTWKPILGTKKDKVDIALNFVGKMGEDDFMSSESIRIDSERDIEGAWTGFNWNSNNNRSTEEVHYTISSDRLAMPLSQSFKCPVQYDNVWHLGETALKKYDVEYVAWGSKGQTFDGWVSQGKGWSDTTHYTTPGSKTYEDAKVIIPQMLNKAEVRTTDLYNWHPSNYNYRYRLENAHAYFTSSDDYAVYDTGALTAEYQSSGLQDEIEAAFGSTGIYTLPTDGRKFYRLGRGLVLCKVDKKGVLKVGLTAKTDNVYFFLYNQPSQRTIGGMHTNDGSVEANGNGVPLIKNEHKILRYNVEPGIYFFRFGTYTDTWNNLEGGAQIEFDNSFELIADD